MPLEDSPKVTADASELLPAAPDPAARRRRLRMLTGGIVALCLLLVLYNIYQALNRPPAPGGLEGCLVNLAGGAVSGTVRAGEQTTAAGTDGCFFFAALPPGLTPLKIETTAGSWVRPAEIRSGQAVSLGQVLLDPTEKTP